MEVSENFAFYSVVVGIIAYCAWDCYLSFRQLKMFLKTTKVPPELAECMPEKSFERARHCATLKRLFKIFEAVYDCVLSLIFLAMQFFPVLWDFAGKIVTKYEIESGETAQAIICILTLNTLHLLTHIPIGIYYQFIMGYRNGFSSQTFFTYFCERFRRFRFNLLLTLAPICGTGMSNAKSNANPSFNYASILVLVAFSFGYYMYLEVIIPKLEQLTPIPDGELKDEINQMATNVGFPSGRIFVANRSIRAHRHNAYFMGLFNKKRIVLCDSLIRNVKSSNPKNVDDKKSTHDEEMKGKQKGNENQKKKEIGETNEEKGKDEGLALEVNEVVAIVCHEFGHWKGNHLCKRVSFVLINLALLLFMFLNLIHLKVFCKAFGFVDPVSPLVDLMVVLQMAFLPFYELTNLFQAYFNRQFEFQSDKYTKSHGKSQYLKRALIKLQKNSFVFPVNDPLFSALNYRHPPLLERIRALDKDD